MIWSVTERWSVRITPAEVPEIQGWARWLAQSQVVPGTPFLLTPDFSYDVVLNDFFLDVDMVAKAHSTQVGYARDLAAFLTFAWSVRGVRGWRDVSESDHLAYLYWRRRDPDGPRISGASWNREVAAVHRFFRWAVFRQHVHASPIPQTFRRPLPAGVGFDQRRGFDELRPATYARDANREHVRWLPPAEYRMWRDIGVRGYGTDGLQRSNFRGRWALRNAVYCDLMVRTGLRIAEQSALTVLDVPTSSEDAGYERFWLPEALAKGGSARWVYVPAAVRADLRSYAEIDRRWVIERAQTGGLYEQWRRPWVVEDPQRTSATYASGTGIRRTKKINALTAQERRLLLMVGPTGLEPAALWLGEHGRPLSVAGWKKMFATANQRCAAAGLTIEAHAHMLRHTFAVVTLEQLQRGHLEALGALSADQRGHYTRVFGDPLDWIRRRLGHRSILTTQVYLHVLSELEMATRMALVPDEWEQPTTECHEPIALTGKP